MIYFKNDRSLGILKENIKSVVSLPKSVRNLSELTTKDGQTIKLNDKITILDGDLSKEYKINFIRQEKNEVVLSTFKHNKTTQFIVPFLGYNKRELCYDKYLLNAYIYGTLDDVFDNKHMLLLYRYNTSEDFARLEKNFSSIKRIDTIYNKRNYVAYVFPIEKFMVNIGNIMSGHYNMLSPIAKSQIISFQGAPSTDKLHKAIYNIPDYRKQMSNYFNCDIPADMSLIQIPLFSEENLNANIII